MATCHTKARTIGIIMLGEWFESPPKQCAKNKMLRDGSLIIIIRKTQTLELFLFWIGVAT